MAVHSPGGAGSGGSPTFNNVTINGTLQVTGVATFSAQPIMSSLTASQAMFTDSSKGVVSNAITGTGNVVMSSNATLVAPALGTPTALLGTNITGTAAGLTAGLATNGITATVNGGSTFANRNLSNGTGAYGGFQAGNDATANAGGFLVTGSGFTTSGIILQDSAYLFGNRPGGVTLTAENAAGTIRLAAGGSTSSHITIATTGAVAIPGALGLNALETITDAGNTSAFKFMSFVSNSAECGNIIRVAQTSVVTFTTSSDYRVKETFGPLVNAGQLLRDLKVYDGMFNNDGYHKPMVLAHEVQAVTPWAVFGDKDAVDDEGNPDYQKVSIGAHEPLLIAGWQELDHRLSAIEQQLKITPLAIDPSIMSDYATRAADKMQSDATAQVAVEARKAEVKTLLAQLFQ